jgi:dolichol-phosphate mannosyltransferase
MQSIAHDSLVLVPTYNEVDNLEPLVTRVLQLPGFDLLVIDDNSPDGTGDLADGLAARWPDRLKIIHGAGKQGLGKALVRGFRYALSTSYEHIFQMDADLSHDPGHLPEMRGTLERSDVVIGSRYCSGGRVAGWSAWRQVLSRLGSVYASSLLGLPLKDLTGGYKGFHRYVLEGMELNAIKSTGFAFQVEVNYLCVSRGFRILEVPITFIERVNGRSKMSHRIVLEALLVVAQLRLGGPAPVPHRFAHVHIRGKRHFTFRPIAASVRDELGTRWQRKR